MLQLLWNAVKVSPAILGIALIFTNSSRATQAPATSSLFDQTAVTSPNTATIAEESSVEPLLRIDAQTQRSGDTPREKEIASLDRLPQNPVVAHNTVAAESVPDRIESAAVKLADEPQTQPTPATSETTPARDSNGNLGFDRANAILAQQPSASAVTNSTPDSSAVLDQINRYSREGAGDSLDQVTNVSQLSDVSPGDWAYEALRNLVERYGCIAGYPDGTFRGNRAMTRYEFAAGLNACLQQVERLISSSTTDFVTKQDLGTLQRLVEEFRSELTTLGTRVDKLEGRVAFLEDHQFSTTTKLNGEAIFALADLFGGQDAKGVDYNQNAVFFDRVRLSFDTSFTGKDRLRTRLQAGNFVQFDPLSSGGRLNTTREGRLGFEAGDNNSVIVDKLYYRFPISNIAMVNIFATGGVHDDFVPQLNGGLEPSGSGALSRFGRYNPIYRMGGQSAGAGITFGAKSPIRVDLSYLSDTANNPSEDNGLFNGNYSALGQIMFQPSSAFSIAATYVHSYDRSNLRHGTGSIASQVATGRPVVGNSYGIEASFAFSPQIVLSGWAA
ncbi:MAG TPA: iron uptake porin, partial [Allocoleopsis sp.]